MSARLQLFRTLAMATAAAALLGLAGCSTGETSSLTTGTTPLSEDPCLQRPQGEARDGVNDEQGGSIPGPHPCDSPGN